MNHRVWVGLALVALFAPSAHSQATCTAKAKGAWTDASTWTCTGGKTPPTVPAADSAVKINGFSVTLTFTATVTSIVTGEITVTGKGGALVLNAPPPTPAGDCTAVNSLTAVADFTTQSTFQMNSCTNFTGALTFNDAHMVITAPKGLAVVYTPALDILGSTLTASGMYKIDGNGGMLRVAHQGKVFSNLTLTSAGMAADQPSGLFNFGQGELLGSIDGIQLNNVYLKVNKPSNLEMKGGVIMHDSSLTGTGNANLVIKQYDGTASIVLLNLGSTLAINNLDIQSEDDSQVWVNPIPVIGCTGADPSACVRGHTGGSSLDAELITLSYLALNPSIAKMKPRVLQFKTDVQVGTIQATFPVATAPAIYAYPVVSVPSVSRVDKVIGESHDIFSNMVMTYHVAQFFADATNTLPAFQGNVNLDLDYSAIMEKVSFQRFGWTRIGYRAKITDSPQLQITCNEVILGQVFIYGTGEVYVYRGKNPTGRMHIDEVYFGVAQNMVQYAAKPKFTYAEEQKIVTLQKIMFVYGDVNPFNVPQTPRIPVTINALVTADYLFDNKAGGIYVKPNITANLGVALFEETSAQVPYLDIDKDSTLHISFTQGTTCKGGLACTLWFSSQANILGHLMLSNCTLLMPPIPNGAVHFDLFGNVSKLTFGGEVHIAPTTTSDRWPVVGFTGTSNTLAIEASSGMVAPDILISHRTSNGLLTTSHIIEPYFPGGAAGGRSRLRLGRIHMANYGTGTLTLSDQAQAYMIADVGATYNSSQLSIVVGAKTRVSNINVVINGILLTGKGLVTVNGWDVTKTHLTIPKQITASLLVKGSTVVSDTYHGFTLVGQNALLDLQSCAMTSVNKSVYLTWDGKATLSADTATTWDPASIFFRYYTASEKGDVQLWPMTGKGVADCTKGATTKPGVAYALATFVGKGVVTRPNGASCPTTPLLPPMGGPFPPPPAQIPYIPYAPPEIPGVPQPYPPTNPPTPTASSSGDDGGGMGSGGVAGIIIAVLVVIAGGAAAAYYFVMKRGRGEFKSIE